LNVFTFVLFVSPQTDQRILQRKFNHDHTCYKKRENR